MKKQIVVILIILTFSVNCLAEIKFQQDTNAINVFIDGNLFTTYKYGDDLTKPVFWPVKSPSGVTVTRGFPFEIVKGETTDHPHHMGLFFAYDKVNDDGFWNNQDSPPQIKHVKIANMIQQQGELTLILHWVGKSGKVLLEEKRDMRFFEEPNTFGIDFNFVLKAQNEKVVFGDTKEGLFAIRLADWLREQGGTGVFLNSEGQKNEPNIWGKRAKWVTIEGQKDGNTIGVAIFSHPDSVNYPAFSMARGYGLFSANPLGQFEYEKATKVENPKPFNLTLQPGQSAVFKFRFIVYQGQKTQQAIEEEFQRYAK